jgi:hypothetical protein
MKKTTKSALKKSLLRNAVQNIRREIVDRTKGQKK